LRSRIRPCWASRHGRIFMRRYLDEVLETEMLLRVIVEEHGRGNGRGHALQDIEVREI